METKTKFIINTSIIILIGLITDYFLITKMLYQPLANSQWLIFTNFAVITALLVLWPLNRLINLKEVVIKENQIIVSGVFKPFRKIHNLESLREWHLLPLRSRHHPKHLYLIFNTTETLNIQENEAGNFNEIEVSLKSYFQKIISCKEPEKLPDLNKVSLTRIENVK